MILGQLEPYITMGDSQVRSRFLFADTLAVDMLFGTELINQNIFAILVNWLKVIP